MPIKFNVNVDVQFDVNKGLENKKTRKFTSILVGTFLLCLVCTFFTLFLGTCNSGQGNYPRHGASDQEEGKDTVVHIIQEGMKKGG